MLYLSRCDCLGHASSIATVFFLISKEVELDISRYMNGFVNQLCKE